MLIYQKAVKVVTRKSRYYDTEAKTGITKTDCTKSRDTQGTKHTQKTTGTTHEKKTTRQSNTHTEKTPNMAHDTRADQAFPTPDPPPEWQ